MNDGISLNGQRLLIASWTAELRELNSAIHLSKHMPIGHDLCARVFSRRLELELLLSIWPQPTRNETPETCSPQ